MYLFISQDDEVVEICQVSDVRPGVSKVSDIINLPFVTGSTVCLQYRVST